MESFRDYKTPGQLMLALLEEKGWTKRVLAIVLGMSESAVNRMVSDKTPVTAELALTLQEVFAPIRAEIFMALQHQFDLARARIVARPNPGRATRAGLFGGLPIAEMVKRRWLDAEDIKDVEAVEKSLTKFFKVESPDQIEILPHAAKKTNVTDDTTAAQLAWLYRVKAIASEMIVSRYSPDSVRAVIPKLSALLSAPEEARKVPRLLAEAGIRFVVVEALQGTKIDGVCFWLNAASPVIGMTLRHDRIDNFWFVLRHELEHVLRLHGQGIITVDTELEGRKAGVGPDVNEEERVANEAGAEFCVPSKTLDGFIARKSPFFAERDLLGLAKTLNVHPGLVAGQLGHRTDRYDRFRSHLVKIRSIVAPSAMVDGWGDVAPLEQ